MTMLSRIIGRARVIPAIALAAILIFEFAYWWKGNLWHEIAGTLFFALVARHLIQNAYWWRSLRKGRYDHRRRLTVIVNMAFAACMVAMFQTSIAISQSLFGFLSLPGTFTLRELHWFAAYWLVALAGVHIGLNGHRLASLTKAQRIMPDNRKLWIAGSGAVAAVVVALGVQSGSVVGIWDRLVFRYSLAMWDFSQSVLPFFAHWLAIVVMFAIFGQVLFQVTKRR